jgi:serine/threonine protein kinase
MELVEGVTLDLLTPRATGGRGYGAAGAAGGAIDEAPLGVIHRDIKPANIMVVQSDGRPGSWTSAGPLETLLHRRQSSLALHTARARDKPAS